MKPLIIKSPPFSINMSLLNWKKFRQYYRSSIFSS